jgi:predicted AAA+ superfamily ATPase
MRIVYREQILKDLRKKMVFISGPRQVGKTTFSKSLMSVFKNPIYLNYDSAEDRSIIDKRKWGSHIDLVILDEIHKKRNWKNYLKGIYDTKPNSLSILVTGSARLETFRKGGDSLTGRYYSIRMLPFTLSELKKDSTPCFMEELLERGGFPEPFFTDSKIDRERWRNQYIDTMIREEILDFEKVSELRSMQYLIELLRRRVGSPISYRNLSEDLSISPNTIKRYIEILESLYIIFRITPFSKRIHRAIQREPKLYFFDWNLAEGDGAILENFAAVHLFKHVLLSNDLLGKRYELGYLRTKDGKEIDFCISQKDEIVSAIEIKSSELEASKNCIYFHQKYNLPITQLVRYARKESIDKGIPILPLELGLEKLVL